MSTSHDAEAYDPKAAGVEFIAENGGGPGVRLRKGGATAEMDNLAGPEGHLQGEGGAAEDEERAGPEAPAEDHS